MNWNSTEKRQIARFGLIAFFFFGILCGVGVWNEKHLPAYFFGFLSLLGVGFIAAPMPFKPAYDAWVRFGHFMARVITTLILMVIYYLVITPAGAIKLLAGGKPLPVKPDKNRSSYWVTRTEPAQPRERFFKRY